MLQFDLTHVSEFSLCSQWRRFFAGFGYSIVSEAKTRKTRQIDAKRNETSKAAIEAALQYCKLLLAAREPSDLSNRHLLCVPNQSPFFKPSCAPVPH